MLERKKGRPLDAQQQAAYDSLVESYRRLVETAGTTDIEVLADYANKPGTN